MSSTRWQNWTSTSRVSTYPGRSREKGEVSVEIEREQAIRFIHGRVEKDAWLEEYFPKQMEVYHNAIEQTKEQLLLNKINI